MWGILQAYKTDHSFLENFIYILILFELNICNRWLTYLKRVFFLIQDKQIFIKLLRHWHFQLLR